MDVLLKARDSVSSHPSLSGNLFRPRNLRLADSNESVRYFFGQMYRGSYITAITDVIVLHKHIVYMCTYDFAMRLSQFFFGLTDSLSLLP